MSKKASEPRINTTIRLPKSVHKSFREICEENHRGASEQIAYWIAQAKKTATIIIIFMCISACNGSHCSKVQADYIQMSKEHVKKQISADSLYKVIQAIPMDSVVDRQTLESELEVQLIDIAMLEITMESAKKQNFDCLHDY